MKLVRGKRKDFKTEEAFLKDIFQKNREVITSALGVNAEQKFINQIHSYKALKNESTIQAVNRFSRIRALTPIEHIAAENVKQSLINQGRWKDFQGMTRDWRGRFTTFDPNLMEFVGDKTYIYANMVRIIFKDSPKGIVLQKI